MGRAGVHRLELDLRQDLDVDRRGQGGQPIELSDGGFDLGGQQARIDRRRDTPLPSGRRAVPLCGVRPCLSRPSTTA
jgi:hypothetical protein